LSQRNETETETERTAGGLVGKVVGKAKEALGTVTDHDDLAREGRLQQAHSETELDAHRTTAQAREQEARGALREREAEVEAERRRLHNEVAADHREEQVERETRQAEQRASAQATQERVAAEAELESQGRAAQASVEAAEQSRIAAAHEANRLEREAHEADRRADNIDPTEAS
jgi:uncharacterized protein YjbJ (UPF0337 family)